LGVLESQAESVELNFSRKAGIPLKTLRLHKGRLLSDALKTWNLFAGDD
jgi:hypothetical protein